MRQSGARVVTRIGYTRANVRMDDMAHVVSVLTDDLTADEEATIRQLLEVAFRGQFDDHDWDHTIGGWHAIVRESGAIVAHGAVVPRTMWIDGVEHQVGYVEAVATAPNAQACGFGTRTMRAIGDLIRERHDLGVLSTGAWHFYERLGWQRWQGPTWVRPANGADVRTPDEDDGIMALSVHAALDARASLMCVERAGDDW